MCTVGAVTRGGVMGWGGRSYLSNKEKVGEEAWQQRARGAEQASGSRGRPARARKEGYGKLGDWTTF